MTQLCLTAYHFTGFKPLWTITTKLSIKWNNIFLTRKGKYKLFLHYQVSSNTISFLFTHFVSSVKVPIWTFKSFCGHVIYTDTHSSAQIKTGCKITVSLLHIWPYNLLIDVTKAGRIINYHRFNMNVKFLSHVIRPIHRINILWPLSKRVKSEVHRRTRHEGLERE